MAGQKGSGAAERRKGIVGKRAKPSTQSEREGEWAPLTQEASEEFDVPLSSGGVVALLMRADLSSQAGADRFLQRMRGAQPSAGPPTLANLQIARKLLAAIEVAILAGNAPNVWKQIDVACRKAYSVTDQRRAVVNIAASLLEAWSFHNQTLDWLKGDPLAAAKGETRAEGEKRTTKTKELLAKESGEWVEQEIARGLSVLATIDSRFAAIALHEARGYVSNLDSPFGLAAKLTVRSRAFGCSGNATDEERKVRRIFEKSVKPQDRAPPPRKRDA
jgi:hypothetical protein